MEIRTHARIVTEEEEEESSDDEDFGSAKSKKKGKGKGKGKGKSKGKKKAKRVRAIFVCRWLIDCMSVCGGGGGVLFSSFACAS